MNDRINRLQSQITECLKDKDLTQNNCDLVITATGEKFDCDLFRTVKIHDGGKLNDGGKLKCNQFILRIPKTNIKISHSHLAQLALEGIEDTLENGVGRFLEGLGHKVITATSAPKTINIHCRTALDHLAYQIMLRHGQDVEYDISRNFRSFSSLLRIRYIQTIDDFKEFDDCPHEITCEYASINDRETQILGVIAVDENGQILRDLTESLEHAKLSVFDEAQYWIVLDRELECA